MASLRLSTKAENVVPTVYRAPQRVWVQQLKITKYSRNQTLPIGVVCNLLHSQLGAILTRATRLFPVPLTSETITVALGWCTSPVPESCSLRFYIPRLCCKPYLRRGLCKPNSESIEVLLRKRRVQQETTFYVIKEYMRYPAELPGLFLLCF